MKKFLGAILFLAFLAGLGGCEELIPDGPADDRLLDGPLEGLT
jgi:hypothetical protein